MKSVLRLLIPIMTLSACSGPLSLYYREGESVSRLQTETTQCQVQAINEVPVANQVRQSPPTYWPGRTYCDGRGRCYRSPGWWQPGRVYTVDVNQGLRNQVEAQCMAKKGLAQFANCMHEAPIAVARQDLAEDFSSSHRSNHRR